MKCFDISWVTKEIHQTSLGIRASTNLYLQLVKVIINLTLVLKPGVLRDIFTVFRKVWRRSFFFQNKTKEY